LVSGRDELARLKMNPLNLPSTFGCDLVGDADGELDGTTVGLIEAEGGRRWLIGWLQRCGRLGRWFEGWLE